MTESEIEKTTTKAFQLVEWQKPCEIRDVSVPEPGPGQAIQVLKALSSAATIVAVDASPAKLEIARKMGADEALLSGDEAVKRIKDITRGQDAILVLDMVGAKPTMQMAPRIARILGHLTVVGLGGGAALPVNFNNPSCSTNGADPG